MPQIAYRTVRSRRKFIEAPKVKRMLADAIDAEVKPHYVRRFKEVVADWDHKPEFKSRKFIKPDSISVNVFPAGPNKKYWIWVSGGTRPHIIEAKNSPTLAFMWGGPGSYQAKTKPGKPRYKGPGTVLGGKMVFPRRVKHPGSKAREFEGVIAKEEKPWFSRTMENIWRRTIRAL